MSLQEAGHLLLHRDRRLLREIRIRRSRRGMADAGLHRHARATLRVVTATRRSERQAEAADKGRREFIAESVGDSLREVEARIGREAAAAKLRFGKRRIGACIEQAVAE